MAWDDSQRQRAKELKQQGYTYGGINKILKKEREANYRQQLAEVDQLYQQRLAQGMTPGQAATGYVHQTGKDYTISDGDSLASIAEANNTTVDYLLATNQNLTAPKTGVVIRVPSKNGWYQPGDIVSPSGVILNLKKESKPPKVPWWTLWQGTVYGWEASRFDTPWDKKVKRFLWGEYK